MASPSPYTPYRGRRRGGPGMQTGRPSPPVGDISPRTDSDRSFAADYQRPQMSRGSSSGSVIKNDPAGNRDEKEAESSWFFRKLAGSIPGRVVMSGYEGIRNGNSGTECLSPWGDDSIVLPNIRGRDIAAASLVAVTGGVAVLAAPVLLPLGAIAAPILGPLGGLVAMGGAALGSGIIGGTLIVEIGLAAGFAVTTAAANDLIFKGPFDKMIPIYSSRLQTTAVKVLVATIQYKYTTTDAELGYFRSSQHEDSSLWASYRIQDDLAMQKGWFSPYLFASARRPVIPRDIRPDVIFCHAPFTQGDYKLGETFLNESALEIQLGNVPVIELSDARSPSPVIQLGDARSLSPEIQLPDNSRSPSPFEDPWQLDDLRSPSPEMQLPGESRSSAPGTHRQLGDSRSPSPEIQLGDARSPSPEIQLGDARSLSPEIQLGTVPSPPPRTQLGDGCSPPPRTQLGDGCSPLPRTQFGDGRSPLPRTQLGDGRSPPPRTQLGDGRSPPPRTQLSDGRSPLPRTQLGNVRPPSSRASPPQSVSANSADDRGMFERWFSPPPAPAPAPPVNAIPDPRRMVLLLVGIKPHRAGSWASSQRPEESVIRYVLFDGCPAVVFPVKSGAPLLAWHTQTLAQLWDITLPQEEQGGAMYEDVNADERFEAVVSSVTEFIGTCVDWERVNALPTKGSAPVVGSSEEDAVKDAVRVLVGAAIRTRESDKAREEVDEHRAGLAMWRIP